MATEAVPDGGVVTDVIPANPPLVESRNLYPAFAVRIIPVLEDDFVSAAIDIQEPIFISAGQRKFVSFRYRSGVPQALAFGLTWHETEAEADAGVNPIQDEPVPGVDISPPTPRRDVGLMQSGTVELTAPHDMRPGIIYGNMAIYQE